MPARTRGKRTSTTHKVQQSKQVEQRLASIKATIKRLQSELISEETPCAEKLEELESLILDAQADIEIVKSLEDNPDLGDMETQIALMQKQCKMTRSVVSGNVKSKTSACSVRSARSKLEAAKIDIELESMKRQLELENQLASIQLEMKKNKLIAQQKAMQAKQQILEEHGIDDRESLAEALDHHGLEQSVLPTKTDDSCNSNQDLAMCITKAIQANNVPNPPVFKGEPVEFRDWEIALDKYLRDKMIADDQKMYVVKQHISGIALEAISGLCRLNTVEAYAKAREILSQRFGTTHAVAQQFKSKLSAWPRIRALDPKALRSYADYLSHCEIAKHELKQLRILDEEEKIAELSLKLPPKLHEAWQRKAAKHRRAHQDYPRFETFVMFVQDEADILNDTGISNSPTNNMHNGRSADKQFTHDKRSMHNVNQGHHTHATTSAAKQPPQMPAFNEKKPSCLHCKANNHVTAECRELGKLTHEAKQTFVKTNKLCFACLKGNHHSRDCRRKSQCKICNKPHPTVMHKDDAPLTVPSTNTSKVNATPTGNSEQPEQHNPATSISMKTLAMSNDGMSREGLCSLIIPIWVSPTSEPTNAVLTYALLDSMSDTTFVTDSVANKLKLTGVNTSIQLSTMTDDCADVSCTKFDRLYVRGVNETDMLELRDVHSKNRIPANKAHIPTPEVAQRWPHLQHIANLIPEIDNDIEIGMLIGYDNSGAFIPLSTIEGSSRNEPHAVQTPLGWGIVGRTGMPAESTLHVHVNHRITTVKPHDVLDMLAQDFNESSRDKGHTSSSQDDRKFIHMLETNVQQDEQGYYMMPLPFRHKPILPCNKKAAEHRFRLLESKFHKDPQYKADYVKFMNDVISSGDAEPAVPDTAPKGQVWYLPHFGVYHPKKPGKVRVVFDCSAKYQGTSLNDHLLQGPDLMNNLVGVLHRFRVGSTAVMCDIQKMFHMFRVSPQDRHYLRFLWYNNDMTEMIEYNMNVHLFGSKSSPGVATFGLRQVALDKHDSANPSSVKAKDMIITNFYVDDGLMSFDNPHEAAEVINSAINICKQANIRLHKFVSNDKSVLMEIPQTEYSNSLQSLDLQSNSTTLPVERALGVQWSAEDDTFQFTLNMKEQQLTRRGILSMIASVYDPLGFIAPSVLVGKNILQQMCKDGAGWDDPLEPALAEAWKTWKQDLQQNLESIRIPRCLHPTGMSHDMKCIELHHFSDASTNGIGQCSYLRVIDDSGNVHVALLSAKSRVAPIKSVTIPRMELQAAVLSSKMAQRVRDELEIHVDRQYFWTDSKVVLGYIQNTTRKFHVYVANRVQQILSTTNAQDWHYVNTTDNPADLASRGVSIGKLMNSHWYTGPAFLWQPQLPNDDTGTFDVADNDPEVRQCNLVTTSNEAAAAPSSKSMYSRMTKFSDLDASLRALCKLRQVSKNKAENITSTANDHEAARLLLLKWAQQDTIPEYEAVLSGKLAKGNRLHKLNPFIDKHGLLRVGGRLKQSELPYDEMHPVILPKKAHITSLIIKHYHEKVAHQGKHITTAKVRAAGYWIIGFSSAINTFINSCITCRRLRRPTEQQHMADLPQERLTPTPPFTYVGSDVFGPFIVRDNRKEIKRYGLIFTCMASRAIHIELLDDMSTDAFINALTNFVSLRGPVKQIRTDQGTNFVGAANEFKAASRTSKCADLNSIEYVTNIPSSSHMGGVWERQIRTVRNVLNGMFTMHKGRVDSTTLRTFFNVAASIVNSRPLNVLSDTDTTTPLTPNQLLTMKSEAPPPPPGAFDEQDLYSRKRWRQVQSLSQTFWSRWTKEYLQTLQTRSKWQSIKPTINVGDIVLVKGETTPRMQWPIARVVEAMPSHDGVTRKVHVKLQLGNQHLGSNGKRLQPPTYLNRPIHKLVVLCSHNPM